MIRLLTPKEISRLGWIEDLKDPTFHWRTDQLLGLQESHQFWGLIQGRQICAFVAWIRLPEAYEIPLLATHPEYQRLGIMRQLFQGIFAATQQDLEVWLEVHEQNSSARALYAALGFVEVGRRPRYYPDGGTALLMTRKSTRSP